MIQILKRFLRAPMAALSVVLLAAVLSASLCALHAANMAEQDRYVQTMENMEVKLIVTNLSGTRSDGLDAPTWVEKVFTSKLTENGLLNYVKDVQIQSALDLSSLEFLSGSYVEVDGEMLPVIAESVQLDSKLVGITDTGMAPEISTGNIKWISGYDDAVFTSGQPYCVLPEDVMPEDWDGKNTVKVNVVCSFEGTWELSSASREMTVVGTQNVSSNVYCSYKFLKEINAGVDAIQATLIDNSLIEEVRELSKTWFAEPNPTGEKTDWDYSYYFWYPYALKIDTDQMELAETTLRISMLINELCAVLVFVLSAGASFFVGFLMIRSRKREIALMRTLGTRTVSVFLNFALEQLLCLLAGTALGGFFFGFQPVERLGLFVGVYFAGLCIALIIFLRKNLLTTLKEDE